MDTCRNDSLNFVFIQTCKAHRARTAQLLSELGVHVGQEMILVALWQGDGVSMTHLAERLEVQPPTVTRMVRRMESNGLVERRPSDGDQRVHLVFVTEKGRAIRGELERVWTAVEEEMTEGWSTEDIESFRRLIDRVRSNLSGGSSHATP